MDLKRYDILSCLDTVWDALQGFREDCISTDDEQWDEICTAISWITERLGYELNENGDYVEIDR